MKRYEKYVIEVGEGIDFDISKDKNGNLVIKIINTDRTNVYSKNYVNPPIPNGYKHICGEWNNGFTIERCSDESQFVWIPVGSLDSNGTIDGYTFDEKFGRRNYHDFEFSERYYHEVLTDELSLQLESVIKYGGFYISRYNISKNKETGKPQSVKGAMPWVDINFDDANKIASTFENNEAVKSHLTFGAEYDSILEWFIKTHARTQREIVNDSSEWGRYRNSDPFCALKRVETGSSEDWCTNNIYDFAGNVSEWTQEKYRGCSYPVTRDGNCYLDGWAYPVSYRDAYRAEPSKAKDEYTGFRIVLYIK